MIVMKLWMSKYVPTSLKSARRKYESFQYSIRWNGFSWWEKCIHHRHNRMGKTQSLHLQTTGILILLKLNFHINPRFWGLRKAIFNFRGDTFLFVFYIEWTERWKFNSISKLKLLNLMVYICLKLKTGLKKLRTRYVIRACSGFIHMWKWVCDRETKIAILYWA